MKTKKQRRGIGHTAALRIEQNRNRKSVEIIFKTLAAAGMTQLAESLGLNLADTLTGDIEFLADILKRADRKSVV